MSRRTSPTARSRRRITSVILPHRRLLRPARLLVALVERLRRVGERGGVVGRFVARHAGPVLRLWRRVGGWEPRHDVAEVAFGGGEVAVGKRAVTEPEEQLAEEVLGGQESL